MLVRYSWKLPHCRCSELLDGSPISVDKQALIVVCPTGGATMSSSFPQRSSRPSRLFSSGLLLGGWPFIYCPHVSSVRQGYEANTRTGSDLWCLSCATKGWEMSVYEGSTPETSGLSVLALSREGLRPAAVLRRLTVAGWNVAHTLYARDGTLGTCVFVSERCWQKTISMTYNGERDRARSLYARHWAPGDS